jgi:hypothetical protein
VQGGHADGRGAHQAQMVHERGLGASGMYAENKYNARCNLKRITAGMNVRRLLHAASSALDCPSMRAGRGGPKRGGAGRGRAGRGGAGPGGAGRGGNVSEGQRLYRSNSRWPCLVVTNAETEGGFARQAVAAAPPTNRKP